MHRDVLAWVNEKLFRISIFLRLPLVVRVCFCSSHAAGIMPLIVLVGHPSSGKSRIARKIEAHYSSAPPSATTESAASAADAACATVRHRCWTWSIAVVFAHKCSHGDYFVVLQESKAAVSLKRSLPVIIVNEESLNANRNQSYSGNQAFALHQRHSYQFCVVCEFTLMSWLSCRPKL